MAQGIDLGYAATLPSKEAVAYFRAKGAHISWNWFETNADVHARSFTAAKVARLDVLTHYRRKCSVLLMRGFHRKHLSAHDTPPAKAGMVGKADCGGQRR
ncbi:hypothetical protein OHD26_27350 [Escherichia coli]|nr:hypothetical protein [Escherichia coli]